MSKRTKTVIILITAVLIIGAVIGWKMWNKPHRDVKDAAAIKITAIELYNSYLQDSVSAGAKYTNKVLEVTGEVKEVSANDQQQVIILLKTNDLAAAVNCTMEDKPGNIQPGTTVVVKGICDGYNSGDADMGIAGDVVIVRGYIIK